MNDVLAGQVEGNADETNQDHDIDIEIQRLSRQADLLLSKEYANADSGGSLRSLESLRDRIDHLLASYLSSSYRKLVSLHMDAEAIGQMLRPIQPKLCSLYESVGHLKTKLSAQYESLNRNLDAKRQIQVKRQYLEYIRLSHNCLKQARRLLNEQLNRIRIWADEDIVEKLELGGKEPLVEQYFSCKRDMRKKMLECIRRKQLNVDFGTGKEMLSDMLSSLLRWNEYKKLAEIQIERLDKTEKSEDQTDVGHQAQPPPSPPQALNTENFSSELVSGRSATTWSEVKKVEYTKMVDEFVLMLDLVFLTSFSYLSSHEIEFDPVGQIVPPVQSRGESSEYSDNLCPQVCKDRISSCLQCYRSIGRARDLERLLLDQFVAEKWQNADKINELIQRDFETSQEFLLESEYEDVDESSAQTTSSDTLKEQTKEEDNTAKDTDKFIFSLVSSNPVYIKYIAPILAWMDQPTTQWLFQSMYIKTKENSIQYHQERKSDEPHQNERVVSDSDSAFWPNSQFHPILFSILIPFQQLFLHHAPGPIFTPSHPRSFHRQYVSYLYFLMRLEHACYTIDQAISLRCHPLCQVFKKQWRILLYELLYHHHVIQYLDQCLDSKHLLALRTKRCIHTGSTHTMLTTSWTFFHALQSCTLLQYVVPIHPYRLLKLSLEIFARLQSYSESERSHSNLHLVHLYHDLNYLCGAHALAHVRWNRLLHAQLVSEDTYESIQNIYLAQARRCLLHATSYVRRHLEQRIVDYGANCLTQIKNIANTYLFAQDAIPVNLLPPYIQHFFEELKTLVLADQKRRLADANFLGETTIDDAGTNKNASDANKCTTLSSSFSAAVEAFLSLYYGQAKKLLTSIQKMQTFLPAFQQKTEAYTLEQTDKKVSHDSILNASPQPKKHTSSPVPTEPPSQPLDHVGPDHHLKMLKALPNVEKMKLQLYHDVCEFKIYCHELNIPYQHVKAFQELWDLVQDASKYLQTMQLVLNI